MNFFTITAILNSVTSMLACIFVISTNSKTKTNRYFALFALLVAIWAFFFRGYASNNLTQEDALLSMRLGIGTAIFIPIVFFHFTTHLINEYSKHSTTVRLLYCLGIIILLTDFTPLFIKDAKHYLFFKYWPEPGPTYIFHTLNYAIIPLLGFNIILDKIKKTVGQQQKQLKFVFWGVLFAYLGGLTNFPLSYNIPLLPIGNIFIFLYIAFITYAIFRYQLMDINIILKKSLIYTILITIITLFYLIFIYLTEHIIQSLFKYNSLFISITSATIIALAFVPLKNIIQNFIEKLLFRGSFPQISEENELLRQEIIQTERLRAVATLASGMAHEIKNPLTVLKTFAEYLPSKMDDKEFLKKFTPMVISEVNRIDNLVHELLDFAKPALPILKPVNIHELIQNTTELLSSHYIKHHITINHEFSLNKNTALLVDSNQIKQALLNILLNAIDAMPQGGQLNISTYRAFESDRINIKIQDTGIGIDQKDLPHIFDPFFSKKDGGTGLGLAITYEIIKNNGGKIFVESAKNKGTMFILEFPSNSKADLS